MPRDMAQAVYPHARQAGSSRAYLTLLRVEIARFTLAKLSLDETRLCCSDPRLTAGRCYLLRCFLESGLSSPPKGSDCLARFADRILIEITPSVNADRFAELGFDVVPSVLATEECDSVASLLERDRSLIAERNLLALDWCAALVERVRTSNALAHLIPPQHVAVQCTVFEKSSASNWLVPIHQDLSIPVADRVLHPVSKGWSNKCGVLFVQPPVRVLGQLLAVRVHLDQCTHDDGPLRVVPRSHTHGRIEAYAAIKLRGEFEVECVADKGDALAMRPLLLHASSKSRGSSRRRVLHFVFGPPKLPFDLRWAHVV